MKAACTFILLLVAFAGPGTCLFRRKHIYVTTSMAWPDAQAYCRSNYVDLSSIETQEEYDLFKIDSAAHTSQWSWIGLGKSTTDKDFTQWSDGSLLAFKKWQGGEPNSPDKEHCVFTGSDVWYDYFCNVALPFFCYTYEPQIFMVQEQKTWMEALKHCRTSYTDLLSLTTLTDLIVANNRSLISQTASVWTGLHYFAGSWVWVNNQPVSNLPFFPSCPMRPWHCGARNKYKMLEYRDCEEKMNFICYRNTTQ